MADIRCWPAAGVLPRVQRVDGGTRRLRSMLQGRDRGAPPAEASTSATRSSMGGDLESSLRRRAPPPPRASAGGPLAGTPPLSPRTWAGLCRAACAAASSAGPGGLRIAERRSVERIVSEVRFLGGLRSSTPRRGRVIREPARTEQHSEPRAAGRRSRSPAQAGPDPRVDVSTGEQRKAAMRGGQPKVMPPGAPVVIAAVRRSRAPASAVRTGSPGTRARRVRPARPAGRRVPRLRPPCAGSAPCT
jgi:hypothetical protein